MQTNLRPMSLGEILDRTAQLYRTNFLLFAGIASVYAGVLLVINLIQLGVNQLMLHWNMTKQLPLASLAYVILIFPIIIFCATAAIGANNRAVAWVNLGMPATIRAAYKSIWPRLGRLSWLTTIILFVVYSPFILIFVAYSGFLFGYAYRKGFFNEGAPQHDPGAFVVVGLVSVFLIVLLLAWVVYAILMGLRYSLAVAACVIEDIPARKAIRRSIELSKESRGRIFMLALLIFAIQLGLVLITQVFFIFAAFAAVKKHAELPVWMLALQQLVGFFTNSFIGPMYATGLTLFYYDQRIRKEGFDIEWMMDAAGMNRALAAHTVFPAESPLLSTTPQETPTQESPLQAPPLQDPPTQEPPDPHPPLQDPPSQQPPAHDPPPPEGPTQTSPTEHSTETHPAEENHG